MKSFISILLIQILKISKIKTQDGNYCSQNQNKSSFEECELLNSMNDTSKKEHYIQDQYFRVVVVGMKHQTHVFI